MSRQLGLRTRRILDHCDLFTIDGQLTEANLDHRIEVHFNAILDSIAEWRRNRSQDEDSDLLTQILAAHTAFLKQNQLPEFTEVRPRKKVCLKTRVKMNETALLEVFPVYLGGRYMSHFVHKYG